MKSFIPTFNKIGYLVLAAFIACAPSGSELVDSKRTLIQPDAEEVYANNPYNFKLLLTDHPLDDVRNVFVNVKQMEFFLKGGETRVRLAMGEEVKSIDLLTLRDGVMLPVEEARIAAGVEIHQVRLVLEDYGNYLVKNDESICLLQTPSGQTSGVKIKLGEPILVEESFKYSMVVDFDAARSVVLTGNGGCILKPVIKIKSLSRTPIETGEDDSVHDEEEFLIDGGDENSGDNDGYEDPSDPPEDWGPIVDDDELQPIF